MQIIYLFLCMCCIGEAFVPGPTQSECLIRCINQTGLVDKASVLADLPRATSGHTVWAVSETRLSKPGLLKFKKQLHVHKTGMQAQMGAPVPLRSQTASAIGG